MSLFKEPIPKAGSGSERLKIKAGDSVPCVFAGDTRIFYSKFNGKFYEEAKRGTEGAKFTFRVNVIVKEGGAYVSKTWEGGARVASQLEALDKEMNLKEWLVKIMRTGSGPQDTTYTIVPVSKLTDAQKQEFAKVKLQDLGPKEVSAEAISDDDGPPMYDENDTPF